MRLKIIAISVASVLLAGLVAFTWVIKKQDGERDKEYRKWQEKTLSLEVQCRKLEKQLQTLEEEYQNQTLPKATTQVLFTDLSKGVYEECFPLLEKFGYTGTLTVSTQQLPGQKDCITEKQFRELVNKGWDICIQWEAKSNPAEWWKNLRKELEKLDIKYENIMYFPRGTYKANLDKKISEMGFEVVISEKDDLESPLQTKYESGIWHIYGMGSMTKQPKKWLKEAVANDANVIYSVGFKLEYQMYNENSFARMLDSFEECVISEELMVCNVKAAREHYRIRQSGVDEQVEKEYQEEKAQLEKKLKKAEKKLKETYALY